MANILIIGCGYIGTALGRLLHLEGHRVWGAKRNAHMLPPMIQPIAVDVLSLTDEDLPPALDYVFYMISPDAYSDEAYRVAYQLGIRNLLFALEKAYQRPKRLIMVSSTGVYAQTAGEWVDESSPTMPSDFAGQRVLNGENMLLDSEFEAVIVRLGGIYGPGREGLLKRVRAGEAKLDKKTTFTNRIHLEDAVHVLKHIVFLSQPEPIYNACDCEPAERNEVIRWLSEQMEIRPTWSATGAASSLPHAGQSSNKRCRNDRLLESGYRFIYPSFREGYFSLLHPEHT